MRARIAVIPAAGLGTRFYPVTKAVPKELLPIYDVPALQLVMDEAIGAGADHIVLVSSRVKTPLEKFVTPDQAVIDKVRATGREDLANRLARIGTDVKVTITYQDNPHGLGHAVGCAREVVKDEPFMLLLPDELRSGPQLLSALADSVEARGVSAIELLRVPMDKVSAYGVITHVPGAPADGPFDIVGIVEKPQQHEAPSNLIIAGRYVCTPDIFDKIDRIAPAANGELQLTDALEMQSADSPITGILSTVTRWDTGTPMGWLEAVVDAALGNAESGAAARALFADRLAR